jgi:hypothetical protein
VPICQKWRACCIPATDARSYRMDRAGVAPTGRRRYRTHLALRTRVACCPAIVVGTKAGLAVGDHDCQGLSGLLRMGGTPDALPWEWTRSRPSRSTTNVALSSGGAECVCAGGKAMHQEVSGALGRCLGTRVEGPLSQGDAPAWRHGREKEELALLAGKATWDLSLDAID